MPDIPWAPGLDTSLALLREGYPFIQRRCRRLDSDLFQTRLLGKRVICMSGSEAARVFYDTARMSRAGAMPAPVKTVLLGNGGVQGLDGETHRERKRMFMDLMSDARLGEMTQTTQQILSADSERWRGQRLRLLDMAQQILFRAACQGSGVPLAETEADMRCRDMSLMITCSATPGPAFLRGWRARSRSNDWAAQLIRRVRQGQLTPDPQTALRRIAEHRERGALLDAPIAGVELLNVLRPTVAIAYYVVFIALALHQHGRAAATAQRDDASLEAFVMEVRRLSPFFPFAAARVAAAFEWRGHDFPAHRRVLLDLYGTNRDGRLWHHPDSFDPSRFSAGEVDPFALIPQGGGSHGHNHRCAGEWLTIELMKTFARFLMRFRYDVPAQDLGYPLNRFPTYPRSRFVIDCRPYSAPV